MTRSADTHFNFKGIIKEINEEDLESLKDSSCVGDIYLDANGKNSYVFDGKSFVMLESSAFECNVSEYQPYPVIHPTLDRPNAFLEDYDNRVLLNELEELEEERENLVKEVLGVVKIFNSFKKSNPNSGSTIHVNDAIEKLSYIENQIFMIKAHINSNLNIVLNNNTRYLYSSCIK